jgi:dipeptidyl-peptidase-4
MTDLAARYAAAEALLPVKVKDLVKRANVRPQWVGETDVFRYTVVGDARPEFYEVDGAAWSRTPIEAPAREFPPHEIASPDKTKVAFLRGFDLWVRDVASGAERQLTHDGSADHPYGKAPDVLDLEVMLGTFGVQAPPLAVWSPDSTRLLTHRLDQGRLEQMHLVQAAPPGGGRPSVRSYRYAMVGDPEVTSAQLVILDVGDGSRVDVDGTIAVPYLSPLMLKHAWWTPDAKTVHLVDVGRAAATAELWAIDTTTGAVRTLVTETSPTQIQLAPLFMYLNVKVLATGEVLWWSERSGWGHLYLYTPDGSVSTLTDGEWLVRDLVAVDEDRRVATFTAAGREHGLDPYVRQVYEVDLDGGQVRRVTDDDLDHTLTPSPSGRFAVDVASSLQTPPRSLLRRLGTPDVLELEVADATALLAAGYTPPERFQVLAADGVTPLYGVLYRPHAFDKSRTYPVLDDIYPGPQVNAAPVTFPGAQPMTPAANAPSMAALGFAVVVIDARGTPLRSKAFQDATRDDRDIVLQDHRAAISQLAQTRPWIDLDRVGIYGISGGGWASTRALLTQPDFYKVAVSIAGDHDDATYHAMWGERFFGAGHDYTAASNSSLVDRLEGKLLLIHGDMDDNVTPHLTIRLLDAFMAADKDVDLLIVPNSTHAMLTHQSHWIRRRWDYLIRHLMDQEPPVYKLAPLPVDLTALEELFG